LVINASSCEKGAQALEAPRRLAFDGSDAASELKGDLRFAHVLVVAQDYSGALAGRKRHQRPSQPFTAIDNGGPIGRARIRKPIARLLTTPTTAPPAERSVEQHLADVGVRVTVARHVLPTTHHFDERRLDEILSEMPIAG
jgi:hypothetical protein